MNKKQLIAALIAEGYSAGEALAVVNGKGGTKQQAAEKAADPKRAETSARLRLANAKFTGVVKSENPKLKGRQYASFAVEGMERPVWIVL